MGVGGLLGSGWTTWRDSSDGNVVSLITLDSADKPRFGEME